MALSDEAKTLLDEHGVFVMPCEINHEAFKLVVYVCTHYAHKPLTFHCSGDGGDTAAALAIVSVIRQHGRVTGLLASEANSSSGVIFVACADRYVYPLGSLGVHGVALIELHRVDAAYAQTWLTELRASDKQIAEVFASACTATNHDVEFWLNEINRQGGNGYRRFDAAHLIACGLAKSVSELKHDSP